MGKFRRRLPWLATAVAILVASGAFASTVFGTNPTVVSKRSVNAAPGLKMSSHSRTGIKFTHIYAQGTVESREFESATGRCPNGRPHPISGFFDSNSIAVALTASRPAGGPRGKQWIVGVTNFGSESANYVVGIICAK